MYKILVVEDNELNLKLFYDLLNLLHYHVITCKEGKDVLSLVEIEKPELILMDIQLNGISGIDLIKILKDQPHTKNIPIIAVSAFAMKNDEIKILQSGCDTYISKPVSIDNFFKIVQKYCPDFTVDGVL